MSEHESPKRLFYDAVTSLLFGLYPLWGRKEPALLDRETASYVLEPLFAKASDAESAGRDAELAWFDADPEEDVLWIRLYHTVAVVREVIGSSGPDAPLYTLKSAYLILKQAHKDVQGAEEVAHV